MVKNCLLLLAYLHPLPFFTIALLRMALVFYAFIAMKHTVNLMQGGPKIGHTFCTPYDFIKYSPILNVDSLISLTGINTSGTVPVNMGHASSGSCLGYFHSV